MSVGKDGQLMIWEVCPWVGGDDSEVWQGLGRCGDGWRSGSASAGANEQLDNRLDVSRDSLRLENRLDQQRWRTSQELEQAAHQQGQSMVGDPAEH